MRRTVVLASFTMLVSVLPGCGLIGDLIGDDKATPAPNTKPCAGAKGVGGPVPAGLGPGDLVAASELVQRTYRESSGFPTGARVWRVLYVSTGVDTTDLQLVCGLVVAPASGPKSDFSRAGAGSTGANPGTGRMFAWAHGTIGLEQKCQPSGSSAFWGPMPSGIGAIGWGVPVLLDSHKGRARDGLLQYAVDVGWVVAATDYQPPDTYLVGRIAAANVLDANRAAAQLVARTWPSHAPERYRFVVSGHSQGGHTVMFTGQLAEAYLAATQPSRPTASFELAGLDAEAPATNFVADPARQPGVQFGDGLADSEMHQTVKPLILDVPALTLQIGPALFSYIFGSWAELSKSPTTAAATAATDAATLPAFPSTGPLDLGAIATAKGERTVADILPICLDDAKPLKAATARYRNAKKHAMLVPPIWNLPADYSTGAYFKGGFDRVCATTTDPATVKWCDWVRWNIPGPLGVNPYPKIPAIGGTPVPVLIAEGQADDVVNCLAPGDLPAHRAGRRHGARRARCTTRSRPTGTAAGEAPAGYLHMDQYRKITFQSPADHLSIRGQTAAKGESKNADDLTFTGSRMQRFVDAAFAGTLAPGCSVDVANAGRCSARGAVDSVHDINRIDHFNAFNAFNRDLIEEFRANDGVVTGPFAGAPLILLTHTGAKSGTERTTPLVFTRDGDRIVVIASKGGSPAHPHWYLNLLAKPEVTVELPGETFRARATALTEGPERERLYRAQAALMPNFAEYQEKTDRLIPVVVLERI